MTFNMRLILISCAILCIHCDFAKAVVGRNVRVADPSEIAIVVSFMRNIPERENSIENHFCAGVIVTRQHVISAAHCTTLSLPEETVILAGSNNLMSGRAYSVYWWINFAEWNNYRHRLVLMGINDISVTKIIGSFHDDIPAGIISPIVTGNLRGRDATVSGWGLTNNGAMSPRLLMGKVKILTNGDCENIISRLEFRAVTVDARFICTNADPFILLQEGDFGGPLLIGNYIVGISKETRPFGNRNIHPGKVNIHMNIDFYRNFILETTSPDYQFVNAI